MLSRSLASAIPLAFLAGACIVHAHPPAQSSAPVAQPAAPGGEQSGSPDGLAEHPPVTCVGSEDVRLENVYINSPDHGIQVIGSCDVEVINSHIVGAQFGIVITGSGDVSISGSTIEGGQNAVTVTGSGDIRAQNTRFIGGQAVTGTGDFVDGGGNSWE